MSPTRRLHGVAALSAAALATAGLAGPAIAADDCTDAECLADESAPLLVPEGLEGLAAGNVSLDFLRQMMEAQGAPQEAIDQAMAFYEQMAQVSGGGAAGKTSSVRDLVAAFGGDEIPAEALVQLEEAYAQLGLDPRDGTLFGGVWPAKWYSELPETIAAFGGEEIPEEALVQIKEAYAQLGLDPKDLFAGLEPGSDAFAKVEDPDADPFLKIADSAGGTLGEVLIKLEVDALSVAEAALAQAAANGDIDQATLEAILGMLPDE